MSEVLGKWTPRDALRVVFRRSVLFPVSASLFATAVLVASHFIPLKYTGTAKFERRTDPSEEKLARESFEALPLTLHQDLVGYEAVRIAIEVLEGHRQLAPQPPNTQRTESKLRTFIPAFPRQYGKLTQEGRIEQQRMITEFMRNIRVSWESRARQVDLISVTFTHSNRDLAKELPNTLVHGYMSRTHSRIQQRLTARKEGYEEEITRCERRIKERMIEKESFKKEHTGEFLDDPEALQIRMNEIESDLRTLYRQNDKAKKQLARLESLLAQAEQSKGNPKREVSEDELEYARLRMYKVYSQEMLDAALLDYTEKHPRVETLRANIASLDASITKLKSKLPVGVDEATADGRVRTPADLRPALAAVKSEVESTDGAIERRNQQLKDYQELMKRSLPVRRDYLAILKRIEEEEAERARWKERLREVQMTLSLQVAALIEPPLIVRQRAEEQFRPSSPKLTIVLGLAFVGGLGFGGALVLLLNFLDRSIGTTEQATSYFKVPVHGAIGEIITSKRKLRIKMKRYILGPAIAMVLAFAVGTAMLSIGLKLRAPERFEKWKGNPAEFVYGEASDKVHRVVQWIKS